MSAIHEIHFSFVVRNSPDFRAVLHFVRRQRTTRHIIKNWVLCDVLFFSVAELIDIKPSHKFEGKVDMNSLLIQNGRSSLCIRMFMVWRTDILNNSGVAYIQQRDSFIIFSSRMWTWWRGYLRRYSTTCHWVSVPKCARLGTSVFQ